MSTQIYDRLPEVNKRHTNAAALNIIMCKKGRCRPGRNQLLDLNKPTNKLLILRLVSWIEFQVVPFFSKKYP